MPAQLCLMHILPQDKGVTPYSSMSLTHWGQGRQTRQNSGGVAEVTNINVTIPGSILKKVHFLAFLRKEFLH